MPQKKKVLVATTPQVKLASAIKSVRDTMRKDAGLNGDLDRLPQLSWLLFLKAFDDLEASREIIEGKRFRPAIDEEYRWRTWAGDKDTRRTGPALIEFVDGVLLPYLKRLSGTGSHDPRDLISSVFQDLYNRMVSGYLLYEVIDTLSGLSFTSSDDVHTMAHLYESMLREMRDAAGDSGEFYTPRPLIRFMVERVDPRLGEKVLDPACGTGGFLVEALEHLRPQAQTAKQLRQLSDDLQGVEKKPLPYLLGTMNLLLHEVNQPAIVRDNALKEGISQVTRAQKVDVILTNPPFGGAEEKAVIEAFPHGLQTAETTWLFLQLILRRLKDGGRCAVVVPNGVLFGDGVGARVKQQLLTECNLHTIVRLPNGVFAPYTPIPANVLFFDKTGRTKETWFYELPPPEGRKNYSKTKPLRYDEMADLTAWWGGPERAGRVETDRAWRVPIATVEQDWNLDLRNPNGAAELAHRPPEELVAELLDNERQILALLESLQSQLAADT